MADRLIHTPIMHRAVVHGGLVFLGGTACDDEGLDMGGQARQILRKLDGYLAEAGSDRSRSPMAAPPNVARRERFQGQTLGAPIMIRRLKTPLDAYLH